MTRYQSPHHILITSTPEATLRDLPKGVKTDTATANFKNGVLEITMEAPQLAKTRRRIQIQGEETQKAA